MPHEVLLDHGVEATGLAVRSNVDNKGSSSSGGACDSRKRVRSTLSLGEDLLNHRPPAWSSDYTLLPDASSVLFPTRMAKVPVTDKMWTRNGTALKESNSGPNIKHGYEGSSVTNGKRPESLSSFENSAQDTTNRMAAEHELYVIGGQVLETEGQEKVLKLSPRRLYELTSSPTAFPFHMSDAAVESPVSPTTAHSFKKVSNRPNGVASDHYNLQDNHIKSSGRKRAGSAAALTSPNLDVTHTPPLLSPPGRILSADRPWNPSRTISTPVMDRRQIPNKPCSTNQPLLSQSRSSFKPLPAPINSETVGSTVISHNIDGPAPSPMPPSVPMPPLSFPAYLHLELSSNRPPSHYIHRSATSDFPYESSRIKIERLLSFLLLPPLLEHVLWFGAFACLDAWLYTFTILPLRFLMAVSLLGRSWGYNFAQETNFLCNFIYSGLGRLWKRGLSGNATSVARPVSISHNLQSKEVDEFQQASFRMAEDPSAAHSRVEPSHRHTNNYRRHQKRKSEASALLPQHKADLMKGLLIILSCTILMHFDASMMYHSIRGQAAIKLYVIYNVLEVCDRLLSALGQDVLECLFSKESLERKPDGRSKVLRPFWLFVLALLYNLLHSAALFYQVITLNVAVNSYSNALLTLLMSNQFVEIKSTVFKKFEKENLFQLTCADVVERFQLWLMLIIIASRNIIETNTLGSSSGISGSSNPSSTVPLRSSSILPFSFTIFPDWIGQVLGPFLLVLGTEMLVDWLKHAYITKFNNVKPNIYGRFLDILAKDYYSNAFADQNLTRRLGLPVIPLSCLFIRASVQTYHMFLATHLPSLLPSPATSLSTSSSAYSSSTSPATLATLKHIDSLFQGTFGLSTSPSKYFPSSLSFLSTSLPSYLTSYLTLSTLTTLTFFALAFLLLLSVKLLLGMALLSYARTRYKDMKKREAVSIVADGKRVGGWGVVEVGEEKRRWIYEDDGEGLKGLRERESRMKERERGEERDSAEGNREKGRPGLGGVRRYSMVAKRIW